MRTVGLVVVLVLALPLSACVASRSEANAELVPPLIADAISEQRLDPQSAAQCSGLYPQSTFVAAFRSTAGEVADIAVIAPGKSRADTDDLPRDPSTSALICVGTGTEQDGTREYAALWISGGGGGLISMFTEDDLAAAGRAAEGATARGTVELRSA